MPQVSADPVQDGGHHRLRPGGARPLGRGVEGQGERRRGARLVCRLNDAILMRARDGEAALEPDGRPQPGPGLVRGPVPEDPRQARRLPVELRALVRPEQEAHQAARGGAHQGVPGDQPQYATTSTPSRPCWSRPTPSSAQARPTRRRSPTRSAQTNITDNVSPGPGIQFNAKGQNAAAEELRDPEPRRQARDGGAEAGGQRQARAAHAHLRQAVTWRGAACRAQPSPCRPRSTSTSPPAAC